ncbi:cysteine-rich receptor-like protein kinase 6 [Sorghum bicolor]|uniref:Uncharacterized protein n=1 Tax=Sorghum bicolor TaxID=4558 RepID=A0A1Z5RJF1_SORBI|nr:cysteine-rich receptor-like protein kinase 6 [Sorghum bicolor]OQU83787.1 hypothetical protein SORBI_3005G175500 [Sorghum bicolor]|eukprot:XP_002451056.2 cysteine-rich receptor-like protein kinase 6 [Sorghum bicolor]
MASSLPVHDRLAAAMHGRRLFTVVVLIFALVTPPADAVTAACNSTGGTYTSGSAYDINLSRVVGGLPTNASASPELFATATVGTGGGDNQTVYAIGLCRGDMAADSCLLCLQSSFSDAQGFCPSDMDVSMDYDSCHMRYSGADFLAASTNNSVQQAVFSSFPAVTPSSAAAAFNGLVARLLNATAEYAAANSSRRFATGVMEVDSGYSQGKFSNIFATAQCTPDLTPAQCRGCLAAAMADMPSQVYARNSTGASLVGERCGFRFAPYQFYNGDIMVQLRVGEPPAGKKTATTLVLAIVLAVLGGLCSLTLIIFCHWRKIRSPRKSSLFINVEDIESFESIFISLSVLRSATSNFDEKNKLGEGGFGVVYKGALPDGQEVAVKRLSETTTQGLGQMTNELALLAKLQHRNLVRIVGVCLEEGEHLLVYDYMPNKSLDTIIFDPDKSRQLDWGARFKIINGIARGMQYLHEHSQLKIVHRDLKASNVLLDADMRPKISDFGLAKIFEDDQTRHVTSRIIGTRGYMSPEYAMRGQYSAKLDIFSFGVLVLEIVTGRRNNYAVNSEHSPNLFCLVWKHWVEGTIAQIADPSLGRHYPMAEVLKCINIGLLCVQQSPTDRPSMSAIVVMLSSDTVAVEAPYRPAYVDRSRSYTEMTVELIKEKEELCSPQSSITELMPR